MPETVKEKSEGRINPKDKEAMSRKRHQLIASTTF
jgi:hypothetical protein